MGDVCPLCSGSRCWERDRSIRVGGASGIGGEYDTDLERGSRDRLMLALPIPLLGGDLDLLRDDDLE